MSYNTKNYTEQGGDKTVIGGTLEVLSGATVILSGATVTGLPVAENRADSVATTVAGLVTDFNALLAKLKAAGIMTPD